MMRLLRVIEEQEDPNKLEAVTSLFFVRPSSHLASFHTDAARLAGANLGNQCRRRRKGCEARELWRHHPGVSHSRSQAQGVH